MRFLIVCAALALVCGVQAEDAAAATPAVESGSEIFDSEQLQTMHATEEKHEFQAEITRLMDIIIHSLYTHREIFLRELISNAADATDKIRYQSLTNPSLLGTGDLADLDIRIAFNKTQRTLSIQDKGIGMTKADLIKNLGIVAKSGTSEFVEKVVGGADMSLIGQFGVGFYSVYLVADRVTVVSKHNDDKQYVWQSAADKTFTVTEDPRGNTLGRGTQVILHLKEDASVYFEEEELKKLVQRYSSFISFPIYIYGEETVTREEPIEEETKEEETKSEDDLEVTDDEEAKKPKTKTVSEQVWNWKLLNKAKAIWTRNPASITEQEYQDFYQSFTKDTKDALTYIHFAAEGEISFRSILYIPAKAEPGHYDKFYEKSTALKLYVRRVLIADQFEDFLPRYLNFIKGVVDSEDLPLNVNRETLAQDRVLKVMSKKITRKALEMLRKLADGGSGDDEDDEKKSEDAEKKEDDDEKEHSTEKYDQFWENFGKSIKLGLIDDRPNKSKLSKLLRYKTSKSEDKWVSLEQYVEAMKEDQKHIYYITGESIEAVKSSPFLEKLQKVDYEVLFMTEPLDEYVVQSLTEFDGNTLLSVTKDNLVIGEENKEYEKKIREKYEVFTTWLKKVYGDKVERVVVSKRLAESPCILVTGQYGWTANMERIMKAQTFSDSSRRNVMQSKKIMEINPYHPMIRTLQTKSEENPEDTNLADLADLLYDAALVQSGFAVPDATVFAKRIHRIVATGVGADPAAPLLPEDVFPEEEAESTDSADKSEDLDEKVEL